MMIKIKYAFALLVVMLVVTVSCKKNEDDGPEPPPPRDRSVEATRAQDEIETFLKTHFYNYEDFQTDPENFKIKFDTIAGDNAGKTPLFEQVDFIEVADVIDTDVTYKLYYLNVREGGGDKPHFSDYTINTYEGRLMNLDLFDSSVIPVRFSLVDSPTTSGIIRGLQQAIIQFKGAANVISNPDGTLSFEDFGIGAVFIPSGLGYYNYPPATGGLNAYDQLIFSFELFDSEVADHDNDGIPSYMEDLSGNGYLMDEDTDGDGIPNYLDDDDDGDGRLTKYEIEIDGDGNITFPDTNGNGTPDYLDPTI
ncbi:FKBP-type peptidyl-prolyl cis-trans isomerase [Aequorivita marisscotiae]|uniref:Peptidylprolyl isomerase n=1 Tax=Aequorivita marisscotiae TaxID=3040348 RepID=A0ABY8KY55_9FLAO|nr:hypothetical protein [Aequorivita sp. Ant34-E75]WGF92637.1 hypothetical protein QCQ61_00245 [Aequorivita sp. Ant34-E75]